ncbi:hypothetical protein [Sinosporangium siamense]|nr:hypothetical protein [Sinosporangium siamense]
MTVRLPEWGNEHRLMVLLETPQVRTLIARYDADSDWAMSAEEFLLPAKILFGGPMSNSLGKKLGVKSRRSSAEQFSLPVGSVLVAVMCSLAQRGLNMTEFDQQEAGCRVKATIPSSWRTFGGTLAVDVTSSPNGSTVACETLFEGQFYTWGADKKAVRTLYADIPTMAAEQASA